ncbi:hypothetical protein L3Q82_007149 [Scortum barcoo]|uniref:Uncharacterized protein n=1 Tax=Scortum barcoo TaxID=214431 RepID=A0ACB8WRC0_9TELE|nr:hypothetical protein L3Q82_007149 [Scortum barcoo]
MIDFVVVSSDLRPYVLDTRVKRGAELSTDHHLVVSWIRWQRRKLDRPGRPKRIVRVCWERLAEPSVREVFNSHLRKSFSQIPREAGDIESEWTMFSASIVDAAVRSKLWTQGLWCLSWRQPPNPWWWTPEVRDAVRLKKESYRTMLACGTPDAVDRYRQAKQAAARTVLEAKTRVWEEFGEAMEEDYRWGAVDLDTGDIVGRWKKYFEDLLNPTDLPSNEEAEAGVSEVDSSITQAEVTEVVRKLLVKLRSGKAPGVDEIRPEYLKSLDVVGLSWLTRLCNIAWRLGTVPLVYARVLERRIRPIVDPRIQEEQCGFRPGRGTLDQLYTLHRVLEGLWEFAQPVHMCFVDLEKAFDRVPRGILWGVLSARFLRRSQGPEGVRFGNHRISSLLFADDVVLMASSGQDLQHVLERFAAECEAAGMRISTSKSEAMVLDRKRVACPLQVGGEVLPQVEEFKYLGVLFTSEGKIEREIDRRIGAASAVMRSVYRTVVVKKELSRKALMKLSIYRSISRSPPSPMVMNFG